MPDKIQVHIRVTAVTHKWLVFPLDLYLKNGNLFSQFFTKKVSSNIYMVISVHSKEILSLKTSPKSGYFHRITIVNSLVMKIANLAKNENKIHVYSDSRMVDNISIERIRNK